MVAAAARQQHGLDVVVLTVSVAPLGKDTVLRPSFDDRLAVLQQWAATHRWLEVAVTHERLLADIADGFDVLILGADKYQQILDPLWYGGPKARDAAMARLPQLAIAPRPPHASPPDQTLELDPDVMDRYSSTLARAGHTELMVPAAAEFTALHGWEA